MIINLYLKEDVLIGESVTLTVMRKSNRGRSHVMNSIPLEKMPNADRRIIQSAIALIEKYSMDETGAIELKYNL